MRTTLYIAGNMGLVPAFRFICSLIFLSSLSVLETTAQIIFEYNDVKSAKHELGVPSIEKNSDVIVVTYPMSVFIEDTNDSGVKFKAKITATKTETYYTDHKDVEIVFDTVHPDVWDEQVLNVRWLPTNSHTVGTITSGQWIYSDGDSISIILNQTYRITFPEERSIKKQYRDLKFKHFPHNKRQLIFGVRGSVEASFMRSYANVAQFNKQEQLNIRGDDEADIGFTIGGFVGMTGKGGSGFYVSADYWRHDVRLAGEQGVNLFTGLPASTDELNPDAVDSYAKFHSVLLGINYFYTPRYKITKPIFELGAYYQYNLDNSNEKWQGNDQGQIINNHFGFSTGLGLSFRYFKAADFSLIPTFRYTFTSFNPDAEIASNNFGFGLKAQVTFFSKKQTW